MNTGQRSFSCLWTTERRMIRSLELLWRALQKLGIPESVIAIIQSFHENMKAQVRVNAKLLEEISVDNGLRQGCSMAPTLFNLHACLMAERWQERTAGTEGVGILFSEGTLGTAPGYNLPSASLLMMLHS